MRSRIKKTFVLLLAVAIFTAIFAGCNNTTDNPNAEETSTSSIQADADVSDNSIVAYVGTNIFDSSLDPIKGAMSYGYSFTNAAFLK